MADYPQTIYQKARARQWFVDIFGHYESIGKTWQEHIYEEAYWDTHPDCRPYSPGVRDARRVILGE
jgi:hypothetical protein